MKLFQSQLLTLLLALLIATTCCLFVLFQYWKMNRGVEPRSLSYFGILFLSQSLAAMSALCKSKEPSKRKMIICLLTASLISYLFMPAMDSSAEWRRANVWRYPFLVFAPFSQAVWGIVACLIAFNERGIREFLSRIDRND